MADEKFGQNGEESLDDLLKQIDSSLEEKQSIEEIYLSADKKPLKKWTMENIDRLIDNIDGAENPSGQDEFDFEKYEEEETETDDITSMTDEFFNESSEDIYFSKDAKPVHRNTIEESEDFYEDVSSLSKEKKEKFVLDIDYSSTEGEIESEFEEEIAENSDLTKRDEQDEVISFFEDAVRNDGSILENDIAAIEADENELKRQSEEFRELDEEQLEEISAQPNDDFDRGDFLKVKDIFKNSKILSRRREQRNNAKNNALENIKEKFGKDVFAQKKMSAQAEDFEALLNENEEKEEDESVKFDMANGENSAVRQAPDESYLDEKTKIIKENDESLSQQIKEAEEKTRAFDISGEQPEIKKTDIGDFNNLYEDTRSDVDENQMKMEGFSSEEQVEYVSEEEVESELVFSSNEKRKRFKLTNLPEDYNDTDTNYFSAEKGKYDDEKLVKLSDEDSKKKISEVFKAVLKNKKDKYLEEFTSKNEIPQIFKDLKDKKKSFVTSFMALAILEIFSIIFTSYPIAQQFTGSIAVASVINILLTVFILILSFICFSQVTQKGLREMSKGRFTNDSMISLAIISTLVYSFVSFFNLNEVNVTIPIFTPIVIFVMMIVCISKYIEQLNCVGNLKVLTRIDKNGVYSIEKIENSDNAQMIARTFIGSNPRVRYSCAGEFPGRFLFNSTANHPADKFSKSHAAFLLALSVVVSVVSAIVNKSFVALFATFTSCVCVCVPVSMLLSSNISLKFVNKTLNKNNCCITGYNAIYDASKTDAVIIKASDLFDMDKCNFFGMREYGTIKADDVVLYASAMLTKANGPLSHVFDKVIIGGGSDMLPKVEDLLYEEKLGLSAWIDGQKVLVGNRNLLINHELDAPAKSDELEMIKEGQKLLYVAVDNHVAAALIVSYEPNEKMKSYLQKLDNNNIKLIVSTNDCNIDEEMLSLEFNIPRENFKVIGDNDGGVLSEYFHIKKDVVSAKLIHDGSSMSFMKCIGNAVSLASMKNLLNLMQSLMVFVGLLIILILSCSGNIMAIGSGVVVGYHIITSLILLITVFIKHKML